MKLVKFNISFKIFQLLYPTDIHWVPISFIVLHVIKGQKKLKTGTMRYNILSEGNVAQKILKNDWILED